MVSVPSFGDSFFISDFVGNVTSKLISFRPLIRGFFFYITSEDGHCCVVPFGFRPLIRGFFFYPVVMICRQV